MQTVIISLLYSSKLIPYQQGVVNYKTKYIFNHFFEIGDFVTSEAYFNTLLYLNRSDYFTGKNILPREKEHCVLFIRAHLILGFMVRIEAKLRC